MKRVVLLINPEPLQNRLLAEVFAEELPAMELVIAETRAAGWRQAQALRGRLALVITEKKFETEDIYQDSEDKSGVRFVADLRAEFPDLPILVWTVDLVPGEARAAGATNCLGKSTDYSSLLAEVRQLLAASHNP
jgi:DNA-binding NarL/FixJ family response regulator